VRAATIRRGDLLVVEGSTDAIAAFIKALELQKPNAEDAEEEKREAEAAQAAPDENGGDDDDEEEESSEEPEAHGPEVIEAVVRSDSILVGRSAAAMGMRRRFGLSLLGIARSGTVSREKISDRSISAGDELLLSGRDAASPSLLHQLGLVAVNRVSVAGFNALDAGLAVGLFVGAIAVATAGLLSFTVAIAIAVVAYAALGLVPAREFYSQIEWPIIVMLACLLPLGVAFEEVGGTALIAGAIADLARGHSPVVALVAIMVVTLTLSDVLNNVATMVITGPIAIDLARSLEVNPDTFLMGVAIAASCAFLTPIGHKNNVLVMGPGGYQFGDYWRMGLPLEIIIAAVAVPLILIAWPL
jgi:di/tricarboxylate transporter